MKLHKTAAAVMALLVSGVALADITIGVSLPLTGPTSGLGIPVNRQMKLWPTTIGSEKNQAHHPGRRHRPDQRHQKRQALRHL